LFSSTSPQTIRESPASGRPLAQLEAVSRKSGNRRQAYGALIDSLDGTMCGRDRFDGDLDDLF